MKTLLAVCHAVLVFACLGRPAELDTPGRAPLEIAQEPAQGELGELLAQADARHAEKSYEQAAELYARALARAAGDPRSAWIEFRLADSRWRSAAQSADPDSSAIDAALRDLATQLGRFERPESRTDLWAELHESLGDALWRERTQDWGNASEHYRAALDWWAHSSAIETARTRYLALVWKAALPEWRARTWGEGYFPSLLDVDVLGNAVRIATSEEDRARAHFLLGTAWTNRLSDRRAAERARTELEAVVALGKASEWYDDALRALGLLAERAGRWERDENGNPRSRPDYVGALELYRRLVGEFRRGETGYWDECTARIRDITQASVSLQVDRIFLPGSEVEYTVGWRNVGKVELELVPVDLTRDVAFVRSDERDWLESLALEHSEPAARWTHDTRDKGQHEPGQARLTLEPRPEPGAYVLRCIGTAAETRALLLVSDAAVSLKVSGSQLLAWITDVESGAPLAGAEVRLFEHWYENGSWRRADHRAGSDADGVALFPTATSSSGQYLVTFRSGSRQGFAQGWAPGRQPLAQDWRIYACTDRGAYRPGDTVSWKLWARTRRDGAYATPSGETLTYDVLDPAGTTVHTETQALNDFGAAWSRLATDSKMTLGEYRVRFYRDTARREWIGEAALFRLEEYKLPEFEVAVRTPREPDGKPRLFRLGDRVEIEVEATYYHGAPVADAAVEVFVHQRPRYRPLGKVREFPWLYDEPREISWWGGPGQQILHESRRSGPDGRAAFAFDTPVDARGEFEFVVEARVVDSSRREIVGQGSVVVTEQGYRVEVEIPHAIHVPGARVELGFRASDPNDNPVSVAGEVVVTRERWVEVWRDGDGRDVSAEALARAQSEPGFPPPGWSPRRREYELEPVTRASLRTDAAGKARFEFTPPREGSYRVAWSSTDDRGVDVRAEARLFVADERTRQLGYLPGGIELLVDQDTLAIGQDALILIAAPQSGRWVLFTVEGEELQEHRVLHLDGQVKLVRLPITERHLPNVTLGALSIWDGRAWSDAEQLVVPPVERFLEVTAGSDRSEYEPGASGTIDIAVKDHAGQPVETTLSVSVVDEAVAYVQGDYAIDPRRFFYGERREHRVVTGGSFQHYAFATLRDEAEKDGESRSGYRGGIGGEANELAALGYTASEGGGFRDDSMMRKSATRERALDSLDAFGLRLAGAPAAPAAAAPGAPEVRVRTDFGATALWAPDVTTDATGHARVPMKLTDSTTRWKVSVRAIDRGTRVGEGSTTLRTRLPLIVRLQAPRFLVVGDEVTLSGNLDNNLSAAVTVTAELEVEGLELLGRELDGRPLRDPAQPITIPAGGHARVDWRAVARAPGDAKLRLSARGAAGGDAMERTLPVVAHGIEAFVDLAGRVDGEALELALELPAARRPGSTALEVTLAPSLAVTMLDALPYLVDYPYGCVEQTLSRFLPAVVVARTLRDQGLSAEEAMARVFGGIERDSAAQTHPKGKASLAQLDEVVRAGLERLYDFQHADGGWGWWKDGDSDPFMSAYVLWGLAQARAAGIEVREGVLENAARFLALELVEEERDLDLQAWMLHALAMDGGAGRDADARRFQAAAFAHLWQGRDGLNAYGRALLCLAAHAMAKPEEARILAANLHNGVLLDRTPDTSVLGVGTHRPYTLETAHWGQDGIWRRWSEGGIEATAFALRALLAVDPEDALVTPVMNWLVKNRRGAQWSNTRDTAIVVLALNDYLRTSGELATPVEFELSVNGTPVASRRLEKDQLLAAPGRFVVDAARLVDGVNRVRIARKAGTAPLYFAAQARFFSLEEPLGPRGNELFVRRDCYRMVARPTLLAGTVFERVPLLDGQELQSGERVEVVLSIEAKNELEYLVFEDLKAAGLEAVAVRSGSAIAAQELQRSEGEARFGADPGAQQRRSGTARDIRVEADPGGGYTGRTRSAHQELRDRHVAFFLDHLPQGLWELRYELRAEVPGRFHALPTLAHAMYVPEIHANGSELRMSVVDPPGEPER